MSAWAVCGIVAGSILAVVALFAVADWIYMAYTQRAFLKRLVAIAREHQLDHSKYLYPED